MASPILSPQRAKVDFNVIGADSLEANPATYYMVEKMAAITRVLFDGPTAEIALAHVFAQCDQPTVNLLSGNVCLRGEAINRMSRGGKGLRIMRRKIERKKRRASRMRLYCA